RSPSRASARERATSAASPDPCDKEQQLKRIFGPTGMPQAPYPYPLKPDPLNVCLFDVDLVFERLLNGPAPGARVGNNLPN
ncbi:unnamed protein product, partial [Symbiodinium natans]